MVTVSPASTMLGFPPDAASATMDFTNSTIASLDIVKVSVLALVIPPSNAEIAVIAIVSDPVALEGTVASITTPNCSPAANVGVLVNGVALSATPSMLVSG